MMARDMDRGAQIISIWDANLPDPYVYYPVDEGYTKQGMFELLAAANSMLQCSHQIGQQTMDREFYRTKVSVREAAEGSSSCFFHSQLTTCVRILP